MNLQSSNYTTSYLTNLNGTARLVTPANASDKQQATFRMVAGLAGSGVSFQASTNAGQYLRHQNFQIFQQANDGGDVFKRGATFTPRAALAGNCGCNTGTCSSYESIDWPGYYVRHQNFNFYIAKPDGGATYNQDASFCAAPATDASGGTPVSLQSSNYATSYLTNVGGAAKLVIPANAGDRQQASFRQVPGLAGSGVSFQASTNAGQYLRHQNFQIWQQANDGGDVFKRGATFTPRAGLAGNCGCTTGACTSYESIDWPGYYLRHQNYTFYIAQSDGGDLFKQDASFCPAPALQQ